MNQPEVQAELPPQIPEKLYFRIGEVSRLVGVKTYVLRYWESEFPSLTPNKSGAGHRFYRRKDVELLLQIKQLLYDRRFTIEGARRFLELQGKPARRGRPAPRPAGQPTLFDGGHLQAIRAELSALLELLK